MKVEDIEKQLSDDDHAVFKKMTAAERLIISTVVEASKASQARWLILDDACEQHREALDNLEATITHVPGALTHSKSEPEYTVLVTRVNLLWRAAIGGLTLLISGVLALGINYFKGT